MNVKHFKNLKINNRYYNCIHLLLLLQLIKHFTIQIKKLFQ